jgi:hypothetical protein
MTIRILGTWSFLGVNILEWYIGICAYFLISLLFEDLTVAIPAMTSGFLLFTFGLAFTRKYFRPSSNTLIKNIMYVWDLDSLKVKLAKHETASQTSLRFLVFCLVLYFASRVLLVFLKSSSFSETEAFIFSMNPLNLIILISGITWNFYHDHVKNLRTFLIKVFPLYCIEGIFYYSFLSLLLSGLFMLFVTYDNAHISPLIIPPICLIIIFIRINSHLKEINKLSENST